MPSFSKTVCIDVDLEDFDDDELVDELEDRGYTVTKDPAVDTKLVNVFWHVQRGELKEALIHLEREFPKLKGISELN